jgi:hypothetical protein
MMTIRNAKTKAAIITIDDDGNMIMLDEYGQPKPKITKVTIEKDEDPNATRNTD